MKDTFLFFLFFSELLLQLDGAPHSHDVPLLHHQPADPVPIRIQTHAQIQRPGLQVSTTQHRSTQSPHCGSTDGWNNKLWLASLHKFKYLHNFTSNITHTRNFKRCPHHLFHHFLLNLQLTVLLLSQSSKHSFCVSHGATEQPLHLNQAI